VHLFYPKDLAKASRWTRSTRASPWRSMSRSAASRPRRTRSSASGCICSTPRRRVSSPRSEREILGERDARRALRGGGTPCSYGSSAPPRNCQNRILQVNSHRVFNACVAMDINLYLVHTGGNTGVEYPLKDTELQNLFDTYTNLENYRNPYALEKCAQQIAKRMKEVGNTSTLETTIDSNLFLFTRIWPKMNFEEQNTVKPLLNDRVLRRLRA
jgi:hypothetical protein